MMIKSLPTFDATFFHQSAPGSHMTVMTEHQRHVTIHVMARSLSASARV